MQIIIFFLCCTALHSSDCETLNLKAIMAIYQPKESNILELLFLKISLFIWPDFSEFCLVTQKEIWFYWLSWTSSNFWKMHN